MELGGSTRPERVIDHYNKQFKNYLPKADLVEYLNGLKEHRRVVKDDNNALESDWFEAVPIESIDEIIKHIKGV